MIDLQRFCAKDNDEREYLRAPWVADGWVYATNGHLCVRVPAKDRPDITQQADKHPKPAALFDKWFAGDEPFLVFPPLPDTEKCRACDGDGWHCAAKCPQCDDGAFDRMGHTYQCLNCEGSFVKSGWMHVEDGETETRLACEVCFGRGADAATHKIGECAFELVYLHWMASLPQARIRLNEPEKDPAAILFDGGQALVMPKRF